jgi:hypothetical protein
MGNPAYGIHYIKGREASMSTIRTKRLMCACAFAFLLAPTPAAWPVEPADKGAGPVTASCEVNELTLTAAAAAPRTTHMLAITAVDAAGGRVTARSLVTGEVVTFAVDRSVLSRTRLAPGRRIDPAFIAANSADGRCPCGQRTSGECWCVSDEPVCCGPLAGCPIGSCGKQGPVNFGDKPVFESPTSSMP